MSRPASELGRALLAEFGPDFVAKQLSNEVVFKRLAPELVQEHFSWHDLNEILARGRTEPAELKLSAESRLLPEHEYMVTRGGHQVVDLTRVFSLMRAGASVIIDSLDRIHPAVRAATDDLMRMVGEMASCNLFVTFDDSKAFNSHYDEVDTFIVQVQGTKHWQVHGLSEAHPLPQYGDNDPARCPRRVVFEKVLEPGDVIHVPRGWWHTVRGGGESSLHLSFVFTRRTGYDWLRWVAYRALHDVDVRESLARAGTPEDQQAQAERVLTAFVKEARGLTLRDFFDSERSGTGGREAAGLPWDVLSARPPAESTVELATVLSPRLDVRDERVVLTAAGQEFALPQAHRVACEVLVEERRIGVGELAERSGTSVAAASALVSALLRAGLVTVTDDGSRRTEGWRAS
ncbi:JmjC domain-containing protein [Streptomyces kroppenstedtii]|uniref:JmjC domain-containing protein n=1 Tax=Streptomyces kroppenstedtii TaxID=3051181 RepID=UPI0028D66892|nr:cupin domain-containing protein [Streptomyces sp. DSM 40484]